MLEQIEKEQLFILETIKDYRTPLFDAIAQLFNFFDTAPFFFLFVLAAWIFYKRYWGISFLYLFLLNGSVNLILKGIFVIPRPHYFDPGINLIAVDGSYAFPSGAAQTALILSVLLIRAWPKSIWSWFLGINFFVWHSFSRLYLGVHYPLDLLGGWISGSAILLTFIYLFPKITPFVKKHLVSLSALQIFLILGLLNTDAYYLKLIKYLSLSLGVCLGLIFAEEQIYFSNNWWQKAVKFILSLAVAFLPSLLFSNLYFIKIIVPGAFLGLWMTLFQEKMLKRWDKGYQSS